MSTRRLFPAGAALVAAILLALPATAGAFGWTEMEMLSAPGAPVSQMQNASVNNRIAAGADGTTAAVWAQNDGSNDRLVARRLPAGATTWEAPQYISPAGEDVGFFDVTVDKDGNATAIWALANNTDLKTATQLAGESGWRDPDLLFAGPVYGAGMAASPDGTVTVAYVRPVFSAPNRLQTVSRDRNSAAWGTTVTVPTVDAIGGSLAIDYNSGGDAVLLSLGQTSGVTKGYISRWDAGDQTWSPSPTLVFPSVNGGGTGMNDAVLKDDGTAAAVLSNGNFEAQVQIVAPDGSLSPSEDLGDGFQLIPQLAIDSTGRFITTWETLDFGTGDANALYSVAGPDGSWSAPAYTPGGTAGAPITLTSNDSGAVRVVLARGATIASISDFGIAATTWSPDSASWGPLEDVEGASATVFNAFSNSGYGSSPVAAMTGAGDLAAMWSQNTTPGDFGVAVAIGDGTAPELGAATVPSSATTGDPVAVSVTATDRWSDIGSVSWSFGDGAALSGEAATHTYRSAGTYTVTVTLEDVAGNSTSTARQITVTDPPAPPADDSDDSGEPEKKPKKTLAPVIEARLAGRSITLNAKVTLKKGARCSGTTTATTAFGGRSYRVTLKLKSVGGACRATGTIKLKKTPSLRTKLRISVAGKQVKSRTLTTRRG